MQETPTAAAVARRTTTARPDRSGLGRSLGFVTGSSLVFLLCWITGTAVVSLDGLWERELLQAINPDQPVPFLDELVLAITDGSMVFYGTAVIWLCLAAPVVLRWPALRGTAAASAAVPALVLVWAALGLDDYANPLPEYLIAVFSVATYAVAARLVVTGDVTALKTALRLGGVTLLSGITTAVIGDVLLDTLIDRPRPLHEANADWNGTLRILLGEKCSSGSGYVSGHASQLFALLTPLALHLADRNRRGLAALLFLWAAVHAWTRLYVAAHFPTDVLMACVVGLGTGWLAYRIVFPPAALSPGHLPARATPRSVSVMLSGNLPKS